MCSYVRSAKSYIISMPILTKWAYHVPQNRSTFLTLLSIRDSNSSAKLCWEVHWNWADGALFTLNHWLGSVTVEFWKLPSKKMDA